MRLLVNCYKHDDSIIVKDELAKRLQPPKCTNAKVPWADISYDNFITVCEKVLIALANHISQPTGR
jgi:hypothetical protein